MRPENALETEHEAAGCDHVVHSRTWGCKREAASPSVEVANLTAKSQPSESAHIDAAAELERTGIGIQLFWIGAAVRLQLGFGVPDVASADRAKERHSGLR